MTDDLRRSLNRLSLEELLFLSPLSEGLALFCPHTPWPRQQEFLDLECLEAFYGGAAGPGKSDAVLMGALQYVHVPRYSALILRKDYQRLSLSGGLIPRSHEWFSGKGPVWNGQDKRWTFPSGATIQFGYLDTAMDKYRYQSSEYQYIAFDESSEFREDDYKFMFSRLRRTQDIDAPLRMRCASNPGGEGHEWHLSRFISDEALAALSRGEQGIYFKGDCAFVPALIRDNPAIDEQEYRQSLIHLDPLTRERLMNGDWSVREDSLIDPSTVGRFTTRGEIIAIKLGDRTQQTFDRAELTRFATVDTAGTSKHKAEEKRTGRVSWSCCAVWDHHPVSNMLFLRHVWRAQVDWNGLKSGIRDTLQQWRVPLTVIESAHHGVPLSLELAGTTQTKLTSPVVQGMKHARVGNVSGAKYERAVASGLFEMIEQKRYYLPDLRTVEGVAGWLPAYESELFGWTGDPDQTSDQIDISSYAADHVRSGSISWGGVLV